MHSPGPNETTEGSGLPRRLRRTRYRRPGSSGRGLSGAAAPAPAAGGSLFEAAAAPAPVGGLFGAEATAAAPAGGLFGAAPAATPAGGLFAAAGAKPGGFGAAQTAAGGLFGAAAPAPVFCGGGLFGAAAAAPAPVFCGGGLSGAAAAAPAPVFGGGGLFGAAAAVPAPVFGGGGLFGAAAAPAFGAAKPVFGAAAPAAPAFGAAAPTAAAPAFGGFGEAAWTATAAPVFGAAAPAPAAGGFGGFGAAAPAAPAAGAASFGAFGTARGAAGSSGGAVGTDVDETFKTILKLSVYRLEKRNEEGELVQEKGWKTIGKGQLRLLHTEGVHFVEFRPEVSEGTQAEPEDEVVGAKTRFLRRPVLNARLYVQTKFEVPKEEKHAVQVYLRSASASGEADYARYHISFSTEAEATNFALLGNFLAAESVSHGPSPPTPETAKSSTLHDVTDAPSSGRSSVESLHKSYAEGMNVISCSEALQGLHIDDNPILEASRAHVAANTAFLRGLNKLQKHEAKIEGWQKRLDAEVLAAAQGFEIVQRKDLKGLTREVLVSDLPEQRELLDWLQEVIDENQKKLRLSDKEVAEVQLYKTHEDEWKPITTARDQARQNVVVSLGMKLAGLSVVQRGLERELERTLNGKELQLPTVDHHMLALPSWPKDAIGNDPRLEACKEMMVAARQMAQACYEQWNRAAEAATRVVTTSTCRREELLKRLEDNANALTEAKQMFEREDGLHKRRIRAESLLDLLKSVHQKTEAAEVEFESAKLERMKMKQGTAPGDPALAIQAAALTKSKDTLAELQRRRDGIVSEIQSISVAPVASMSKRPPKEAATEQDADATLSMNFPELPVRAQRIVKPLEAYESMSATDKERFDMDILLQRTGLLIQNRTDASYSPEGVPNSLKEATQSKPHVKGRVLLGAAGACRIKILKEYKMGEFKRVKRAISMAGSHSLGSHPGIVPIECAFVEGDKVVVQSPFYSGGNLKQWCPGKSPWSKLVAAQRIAEAVRFMHEHGMAHRDLKPDNIVFSSSSDDAVPALCDFDLSRNVQDALTCTTTVGGTLLYMPPSDEERTRPTQQSDIFSLGVTFYIAFICDGSAQRLPLKQGSSLDLETMRSQLSCTLELDGIEDPELLSKLLRNMIATDSAERPSAGGVADELNKLLDVRTCYVCHCPSARLEGVECPEAHFVCNECFSAHVMRADAISSDTSDSVVCCAKAYCKCTGTFTLQQTVKHATLLAFETLQRNMRNASYVKFQGAFEGWKKEFEQAFAAKSEAERQALAARKSIEELMDLRCPKCRNVFDDFEGCAALKCQYANCNASFCAFCLVDCDADAHAHVRTCPLNPRRNEYYVSKENWKSVIDGERRRKLQELLATFSSEVKDALGMDASIQDIMQSLNLPQLAKEDFHQQLAQLRGMGFTDRARMLTALRLFEGDVAQAISHLTDP